MENRKLTVASTGPRIQEFVNGLIRDAGFELRCETGEAASIHPDFENPDIVVHFFGRDVDLLLANKAELLLAMEHLTMEMLRMSAEDHARLQFDANDYRALRIEELRLSAITAAEKVKRSRMPFEFSPMNSRERRIIHLALRGEPDVRSESAGFGSHRQVVIYPADMPSKPAGSSAPPPRRGRR